MIMARKPRIHQTGAFFHVMLRGNNGQQIFFSDYDRCRFCHLIQLGTERFGYSVSGFCLMNNHVHLVLKMGEKHISHAIHNLAFRYSRYINYKEKMFGHLFQGRFKSILVDDTDYLLELIRYVHLNPVRANLVAQPEDYRWSGHRCYSGLDNQIWLNTDDVLRKFDSHEITARSLYVDFVRRGIGQEPQSYLKHGSHEGRFLGTDEFFQKIISKDLLLNSNPSYSLEKLIEIVCNVLKIPLDLIHSPRKHRVCTTARGIIAFLIKNSAHLTLKAFADYVGQDLSSLSKLADRIQCKSELEPDLKATIINLKELLKSLSNDKCQA